MCNACGKLVQYKTLKNKNTAAYMMAHAKTKHNLDPAIDPKAKGKGRFEKKQDSKQPPLEYFTNNNKRKMNEDPAITRARQQVKTAIWVCSTVQPLKAVEEPSFRGMIQSYW